MCVVGKRRIPPCTLWNMVFLHLGAMWTPRLCLVCGSRRQPGNGRVGGGVVYVWSMKAGWKAGSPGTAVSGAFIRAAAFAHPVPVVPGLQAARQAAR